jgi:hypothetical protein
MVSFKPRMPYPGTRWVEPRVGLYVVAKRKVLFCRELGVQDLTALTQDTKSCPTTHHEGAWVERRYSSYSYSTSALDDGEWSASRPGERTPGIHCTARWVSTRAGLDTEATGKILLPLPGIEPRSPGRPTRSQKL